MQGEFGRVNPKKPNKLLTIDYYEPLPMSVGRVQHLLVTINAFLKYVKLYTLKSHNIKYNE